MIYKQFKDKKLSSLGLGCMRFPTDESGAVDMQKTEEIIDLCMREGVNYYDTAWFYHQGKSEEIIGHFLSKYPRDSFYIADKMPFNKFASHEEVKSTFETQLARTGMEYFDFYLLHNVSDDTVSIFTDENLKIMDYLLEQKAKGRIRHLGFSTHATVPVLKDFLAKYHENLEFCQIQLNWLDYKLQNAKEKVEILNSYGIPIWVMEPVRGGRLAALSEEDEASLRVHRPEESIPAWCFRFLQGIKGVTVVLSGMSNLSQVADNIKTHSEKKPLSADEQKTLLSIADKLLSGRTLTCTNCKYCVTECPMELPIPKLLRLFNDNFLISGKSVKKGSITFPDGKMPSECIACRACEEKCPQKIEISAIMAEFAEKLEK